MVVPVELDLDGYITYIRGTLLDDDYFNTTTTVYFLLHKTFLEEPVEAVL